MTVFKRVSRQWRRFISATNTNRSNFQTVHPRCVYITSLMKCRKTAAYVYATVFLHFIRQTEAFTKRYLHTQTHYVHARNNKHYIETRIRNNSIHSTHIMYGNTMFTVDPRTYP